MTFGRREFLNVGGVFAGAALAATAQAAPAAAASLVGGRSVTDFGVEPNSDKDQTAALQKAIDEISKGGHPVFIPGGQYYTGTLEMPAEQCAITGVPGRTIISSRGQKTIFAGRALNQIMLSGLTFDGGVKDRTVSSDDALILLSGRDDTIGGVVSVQGCRLEQWSGTGLRLENCSGTVQNNVIALTHGAGIWATKCATLTISQCQVWGTWAEGIKAASRGDGNAIGLTVSGNHVQICHGAGIAVQGNAVVSANHVARSRFGLRLGGGGEGHILANGNLIRECSIGLGVTASGETIFASLNLINAPKDGGIRAFDGDKLVGPDLVRQSAESYLNLTLGGNVVR